NITPLMMASGLTRRRASGIPFSDEEGKKALESVRLAIDLGADVNAVETRGGMTALHGAAFNAAEDIIRLLVQKGADLNARDKVGQSALDKAENNKPKGKSVDRFLNPYVRFDGTVELLLKLGAAPTDQPRKTGQLKVDALISGSFEL